MAATKKRIKLEKMTGLMGNKFRNTTADLRIDPGRHVYISISKVLICIALAFFWVVILSQGIGAISELHRQLTVRGTGMRWARFFWVSYDIAVVGIILYCAGSGVLYSKCMAGWLFRILALGYMAGVLLSGDRGGFIRFLPIPIMAFHYFQKRIKLRWLVVAALALIFVSSVIGAVRKTAIFDVTKMAEEYKYVQPAEHGAIVSALVEFGGSIKVVGIAMELVPSRHRFWYGTSYIDSLQVVLPNIIPGILREQKGIGPWITEQAFGSTIHSTWGRGGSIAMEAYMNLGTVGGIIFFVLLGAFYRFVYERFLARPDFLRTVLVLAVTSSFMLWIRNTVALSIRSLAWPFLLALMLQYLFSGNKRSVGQVDT